MYANATDIRLDERTDRRPATLDVPTYWGGHNEGNSGCTVIDNQIIGALIDSCGTSVYSGYRQLVQLSASALAAAASAYSCHGNLWALIAYQPIPAYCPRRIFFPTSVHLITSSFIEENSVDTQVVNLVFFQSSTIAMRTGLTRLTALNSSLMPKMIKIFTNSILKISIAEK